MNILRMYLGMGFMVLFLLMGSTCPPAFAGSIYNYWIGDESGGDGQTWEDALNWGELGAEAPGGVDAEAEFGWPDTLTVWAHNDLTLGHFLQDGWGQCTLALQAEVTFTLAVTTGQPTLTATDGALVMQSATIIHGSQGFEKLGAGDLYLFAESPYTGVTTVSAGTIIASDYLGYALGAAGTGNETIIADGARVELGQYTNCYESFTLTGAGGGNGALSLSNGTTVHDDITLLGDATISAAGASYAKCELRGAIDVSDSDELTLHTDGYLGVHGVISGDGGSLKKTGSGALVLAGASTYTGGTLLVAGTMTADNDGALGSGSVVFEGGLLIISEGVTVANTLDFATYGAGTIGGVGTFQSDVVAAAGAVVAPGQSPGVLTIDGDFTLDAGAALEIELGGTTRGDEYDALVVTGQAELAGVLNVSLINDYNPVLGDTFDILDWSTLAAATFSDVNLPGLNAGLAWNTDSLYTDGSISVTPEPATMGLLAMGGLAMLRRRRRK